ncbi:hypothetical protein F2P56_015779 [Juglans regia]|uniref:Zinc finger BED domain-containing protein RICESLEEPER 2-like n=1 Tax=Juglans regia TaxID=51240 RepID=A0A833XGA5_JUGRE|nr:hypothetical protein F2P56_015779 [Juglans regia]
MEIGASASSTSLEMHDERPQETYVASTSSKRRKSVSEVWNDFYKDTIDGEEKAVCKRCKGKFVGSSKSGTTHLKNHLSSCPAKKVGETHTKMMSTRLETAGVGRDFVFNDEMSRLDAARMIIKHGYPLDSKLWPQDALKGGILRVYEEEKKKLHKYLGTLSCHFNLIIQFWTCHRKKNVYYCFALQFLEDCMRLRKKILALKKVDQYDDIAAGTLFGTVTSLLQEWNIDKKLYSIILRSSHPNDKMVPKLGICLHNGAYQLPLRRNFFHIHCTTDILNLLFQNGWKEVDGILGKIRNAARYIDEERLHSELNFDQILEQHHFQGKYYSVSLRWDSALLMLEKALNSKNLISLLKRKDRDLVVPSMDEWDAAMVVYKFLRLLYDDSCHFLGCKCPTANMYFSRICGIHFKLLELEKSKHQNICIMATKMKIPFDKYFEKCRTVLAIASILDPRRKHEYVKYAFTKCYDMEVQKDLARNITNALNDIFDYYEKELGKQALSSSLAIDKGNSFTSYHDVSPYDELNKSWREEKCSGNEVASRKELNRYLAEPCIDVNDEFDILDWWRSNSQEFPTLKKMALDILGIPMSTDLDFGIGDMTKIIDPAFNGLHSDIIEALICGNDWLDMSTNKTPIKEIVHSSSYTLNGKPTGHDYTSMAMGGPSLSTGELDQGRPDSSRTNMDLTLGFGQQHGTQTHDTPISRFQVPVSQESLSQPLPCVPTTANINPTMTVPQETEPNLGFEIGPQHGLYPHRTPTSPRSQTFQGVALQDSQPLPRVPTTANINPTMTMPQETRPNLGFEIGPQHGLYPHRTPISLHSQMFGGLALQEPNSQPPIDCMLGTANNNSTATEGTGRDTIISCDPRNSWSAMRVQAMRVQAVETVGSEAVPLDLLNSWS